MEMSSANLEEFLSHFEKNKLFWPSVKRNREHNPLLFDELGSLMINWAKKYLGSEEYKDILIKGYKSFVSDVGKSQMEYEKRGAYQNKSYAEVYNSVYNNSEHMQLYHWGVYVTTFAWEHHLRIYSFFKEYFLPLLIEEKGSLLELGSGSGIWGLLFLTKLSNWNVVGVDISESSVGIANKMREVTGLSQKTVYKVDDALSFASEKKYDAAISCFLLEHIENPERLFQNISNNINPGGYAFVTGALTAAEVDHITEFKYESQIVKMAEDAGFRVIGTYSASPSPYPINYKFLPRSMALIIQKRRNEIW